MAEFPFVERLARRYLKEGKVSRCWSDYLKAHGLANYCVARDPRDQGYELVYEIEKSWYNGKHPLTYSQHTDLTMKHKTALSKYRGKMSDEFYQLEETEKTLMSGAEISNKKLDKGEKTLRGADISNKKLEKREKTLSGAEISNENDLKALAEFSNDVFSASRMCSEGFIEVTQEIMLSCVEVLECSGLVAPCHYEVIAFGAVAKGEGTPYSDLEYAFIVESEDEYFTKLAVDSYFRIGNLGETPVGCFDIDEVKARSLPLPDLQTVGYRIDGIRRKAGFIPTGRKGGQSLTLTVDGFMELYERAAMSPFVGIADISDMLSSSVLVYSHQTEGSLLYEKLQERIMEYEQSTTREKVLVNRKRLHSFAHDIKSYHFLPEHSRSGMAAMEEIKVKVHVFQYPTLLANNLRLCKSLGPIPPWTTFDRLQEAGLLSPTNCKYLQIALALSIYIRTKAYISMRTQCRSVSLLPSSVKHDSNMYHVPQNLFVILGCLTIPIKLSIRSKLRQCFELVNRAGDMQQIAKDLTECMRVDETDFMLKVELLFFLGDFRKALVELDKGVGGSFVNLICEEFIDFIRQKYNTVKADYTEHKFLRLCALTLKHTSNWSAAVDYLSWLAAYAADPAAIARYKSISAECMIHLGKWKVANHLLKQAIATYKKELGLDDSQDPRGNLDSTIRSGRSLSDIENHLYPLVIEVYTSLGEVYKNMHRYAEAIQALTYSLSICSLLLHAFCGSTTEAPELTSIATYISRIDINNCSSYVRHCLVYVSDIYNRLFGVYSAVSNVPAATEYAFEALHITLTLYGAQTNHVDIAAALGNIGNCYSRADNFTESAEYYERALTMLKALHGADAIDHTIAGIYNNLGSNMYKMGGHMQALGYLYKAWGMYKVLYSADPNHPDMMYTCRLIAEVHLEMGEYTTALQYSLQVLSIVEALYGAGAIHSDIAFSLHRVGRIHGALGNHTVSLSYLMKELAMLKALSGADSNHPRIATCYLLIGQAYRGIGRYGTALEYSIRSQKMSEALGSDQNAVKIHHEMGICCTHLSRWKEAWSFLYLSLRGCQSSPKSDLDMLTRIHLSISELLLCLENVSQSLEHAQIALDLTKRLLADESKLGQKFAELNVEARALVDSLQLIKIFQYRFVELQL